MKNIAIFRIFVAFPLIGIALPDLSSKLDDAQYNIPSFHLIIMTSLLSLLLLSYGVKYIKFKPTHRQQPLAA